MQLYPAIDLNKGLCVRLKKGDYQQETVYSENPFEVANGYISSGAKWLHIIDLSGAKDPTTCQMQLIGNLANHLAINIQTGGGIRTQEHISYLLEQGVSRVIVGSLAVKEFEKVRTWLKKFGSDKIVLAFDCQINQQQQANVMIQGWQEKSRVTLDEILNAYAECNIKHVLCTDIEKDGMLEGPNIELYTRLRNQYPLIQFQASGGVKDLGDIRKLNAMGMPGVVIGKALYENKFTLQEALEVTDVS